MLRQFSICLLSLVLYAGLAEAQTGRGELLYTTHCNECHTTQAHWREKKLATDWGSLVAEVGRWQANARLEWSDDDVDAVARYLNAIFYRYSLPKR